MKKAKAKSKNGKSVTVSAYKRREPRTSLRHIAAVQRQATALQLRLAGANCDTIAQQLGYADRSGASRAIKAAMLATIKEPAEELRKLEAERYDALQMALWAKRADPATARVLVRLFDRRAKLLGLDLQPDLPPFILNIVLAVPGRAPRILRSLADVEGLTDEELEVLAQLQETEEGKTLLLPQRAYDIT